jgi:hypothetical protein
MVSGPLPIICLESHEPVYLNEILQLGVEAVDAFLRLENNTDKNRRGCYLTIHDQKIEQILAVIRIGSIATDADPDYGTKAAKYFTYSLEKAIRLYRHLPDGHFSSWQSRDTVKKQLGGAVASRQLIFACSGFSEYGDEAIALCFAEMYGVDNSFEIAKYSGNPFWEKMYDWFNTMNRWQ